MWVLLYVDWFSVFKAKALNAVTKIKQELLKKNKIAIF
jgi:hypothetical protein